MSARLGFQIHLLPSFPFVAAAAAAAGGLIANYAVVRTYLLARPMLACFLSSPQVGRFFLFKLRPLQYFHSLSYQANPTTQEASFRRTRRRRSALMVYSIQYSSPREPFLRHFLCQDSGLYCPPPPLPLLLRHLMQLASIVRSAAGCNLDGTRYNNIL